jgi:hypothetical protein
MGDFCLPQLEAKTFFIRGFEQPGPKGTMNIDCETNYPLAQRIAIGGVIHLLCVLCVLCVLCASVVNTVYYTCARTIGR